MSLKTQEERETALKDLKKRKEEAFKIERVNNASLPAGSPMYYYCRFCGLETDVLSENHVHPPRRYCTKCQELKDSGWDGDTFVEYEIVDCGDCEGTGITCRRDYYTKRPRICLRCNNGKIKRKINP